MLFKTKDAVSGKVLKHSKPLLIQPQDAYVRPAVGSKDWWATTTTVWSIDELMRRRINEWRRLTAETGHSGSRTGVMRKDHNSVYTGTNSVFPAPLVECILLRYAPPEGGHILDAFAGGPPRAMVATLMGYQYTGFEIRREQIYENEVLLRSLGISGPRYIEADGCAMKALNGQLFDFGLTCPPYYNLEKYSDLPEDISNWSYYDAFLGGILICATSYFRNLKKGAFMCIVTAPFRDKKTKELLDFPADTVRNFCRAGFEYHQQIVLKRNFASAAKRASNAWKGKKLVPAHEFLLVFRKP